MKRLTEYTIPETGFSVVSEEKYKRILMEEKPSVEKVYNRLKKIEDILGDEYDLEALKTIWENYKRGKCVLAPFIPGQLVWLAMDYGLEADEVIENYGVSRLSGGCISKKDAGKIAFSTKKEAEAALRREQDG